MIPEVTVLVDENPNYDTDIDTDTQDRVFLLGISEVNMYFHSDNERECKPTKYALSKDVRVYDSGNFATTMHSFRCHILSRLLIERTL